MLINLILSIFLLDPVGRTRQQISDLENELASKQDVAMLRPRLLPSPDVADRANDPREQRDDRHRDPRESEGLEGSDSITQ